MTLTKSTLARAICTIALPLISSQQLSCLVHVGHPSIVSRNGHHLEQTGRIQIDVRWEATSHHYMVAAYVCRELIILPEKCLELSKEMETIAGAGKVENNRSSSILFVVTEKQLLSLSLQTVYLAIDVKQSRAELIRFVKDASCRDKYELNTMFAAALYGGTTDLVSASVRITWKVGQLLLDMIADVERCLLGPMPGESKRLLLTKMFGKISVIEFDEPVDSDLYLNLSPVDQALGNKCVPSAANLSATVRNVAGGQLVETAAILSASNNRLWQSGRGSDFLFDILFTINDSNHESKPWCLFANSVLAGCAASSNIPIRLVPEIERYPCDDFDIPFHALLLSRRHRVPNVAQSSDVLVARLASPRRAVPRDIKPTHGTQIASIIFSQISKPLEYVTRAELGRLLPFFIIDSIVHKVKFQLSDDMDAIARGFVEMLRLADSKSGAGCSKGDVSCFVSQTGRYLESVLKPMERLGTTGTTPLKIIELFHNQDAEQEHGGYHSWIFNVLLADVAKHRAIEVLIAENYDWRLPISYEDLPVFDDSVVIWNYNSFSKFEVENTSPVSWHRFT